MLSEEQQTPGGRHHPEHALVVAAGFAFVGMYYCTIIDYYVGAFPSPSIASGADTRMTGMRGRSGGAALLVGFLAPAEPHLVNNNDASRELYLQISNSFGS
jgi:hypothetical protein